MSESGATKEAAADRARGVLFLLSGQAPVAAAAAELVGARVLAVEEEQDACEAIRAERPELVVVTVPAGWDLSALAAAVVDAAPAELLLLFEEPGAAEALGPETSIRHWLGAPFSPETVALLCAAISPRDKPPVRARQPSLASSGRLYDEARDYVARVLEEVASGGEPDIATSRLLAEGIHTDLLRSNALVNRSLQPHEAYDLASHSVNVAIIAGRIARGMSVGVEDEIRVVQAGLVHDLGMARLPDVVLRRAGRLSAEEREELQRHPVYGAEALEGAGRRYEWLQRAVLQEHERLRGQGYPAGLAGDTIDEIAQILGVADVFEALSHPRVYRSPYTGLEALETVVGMQEEYFSPILVAALVNEISAFPLDSHVQLSTGEIARVVATNPSNLLRPVVDVLWDADWTPLVEARRIELAAVPDVTVARALLDTELPIT